VVPGQLAGCPPPRRPRLRATRGGCLSHSDDSGSGPGAGARRSARPASGRANSRPQPWTLHESARRVPCAPRVSAPPRAEGRPPVPPAGLSRPSGGSCRSPRPPEVPPRLPVAIPFPRPPGRIQSPEPSDQRFSSTRFPRRAPLPGRGPALREARRIKAYSFGPAIDSASKSTYPHCRHEEVNDEDPCSEVGQ
jgi:hypothetical protein